MPNLRTMSEDSPTPPEQDKQLTWLGQFLGDVKQVFPEAMEKNVIKAASQMIFGVIDIPAAYMEQFSKRIRRKTEAMDMIQQGENAAIVKLFEQDPALAQETLNFGSLKEYKAFFNRQKVMQGAMDELKNNPPEEDSDEEIDEDWLEMFSRAAETKSNDEVQMIFSKILAGEMRKPGQFSLRTLLALTTLDALTAGFFVEFCSAIFQSEIVDFDPLVIQDSYPIPNEVYKSVDSGPQEFPFWESNYKISLLQEANLIGLDNSTLDIPIQAFINPHSIGNKRQQLEFFHGTNMPPNYQMSYQTFKVLQMTSIGKELFKVVQFSFNKEYNMRLNSGLRGSFKVLRAE